MNFLFSISYMGCHPSHSLSYLSEGFKPPTRYNMICSWTTSRVILAQYLRFAMTKYMPWYFIAVFVGSFLKTPRKAGIGRCFHSYSPRRVIPTYLFLLRLNPPISWFINSIVYRLFYHKSHWCCFHQLIAKKLSKIAKSDERRPPITYLVPSVIPLSHHWMPFKHPHFFEIPKSPWNTGWNSYRKHRSCGRRCGEQDQESLGRAISCASKSQEILGEWNMAGKYISVMVIHGG